MSRIGNHTSIPVSIPKAVMHAALPRGKLNVCHGNSQSLCARRFSKFDEIKNCIYDSKIEIACFTESWLTASVSDQSIAIPGFSLIRNDRLYKRGGGIVVYFRNHLRCKKVFHTCLTEESSNKAECLALEVQVNNSCVLLMVVYNPPDNDCSAFLEDKLADFSARYESIFLIGDFNTNLLRHSRKRSLFESVLQTFSMQSIGEEPTYFGSDCCSQLDLFVTCCRDKVLRFDQVSFPAMSQHDLIFVSLDFDVVPSRNINMYRDYTNFDPHALEIELCNVPWDEFYCMQDVNDKVCFFNAHLKAIHDRVIPLRPVSKKSRTNPWFNDDIRKSMLERDLAYRDWLRASPETKENKRQQYKTLRNRTNLRVTEAKKEYLKSFLGDNTTSNQLWKRIKSLGVGKEISQPDCNFDPDDINREFCANFTNDQTNIQPTITSHESHYSFAFNQIQSWEIVNAVWETKSNAMGLDGIPIKYLKIILPLVIEQINHMFNKIIETSVYPTVWKHAKVLPIRKKAHVNSISNLRPISILCALSKVFEKILKNQMTNYLESNNLLFECQAGFSKNQSVKTAVLRVYDDIGSVIDKKGIAILLLLDFSKAFDTISHQRLCRKLQMQFNFSANAVRLMASYMCERLQTVFCGEQRSCSTFVTSGVPQGSVLGPLLFCCYINDLPNVLKFCCIQLYADDVQLYITSTVFPESVLVRRINEDLRNISEWSRKNFLFVNHEKSKALLIRNRRQGSSDMDQYRIEIDGNEIQFVEKANNLGFIFQSDLEWDGMISQQCGKIYGCLRTLYNSAFLAPVETKVKLFKTLILPHFLFGDVLHISPSAASMNRLRLALNNCVRFVYGLNRFSRVSHLHESLLGCSLHSLYGYRSCLFVRKLLVNRAPKGLYEKLVPFQGRRLMNLTIPTNSTRCFANSFFVRGVVNWNLLPSTVKHSSSEAIFKRGCLDFWNSR